MNRSWSILASVLGLACASSASDEPSRVDSASSQPLPTPATPSSSSGGAPNMAQEAGVPDSTGNSPAESPLSGQIASMVRSREVPIVVEIDSVQGLSPYEASEAYLVGMLEDVLDKPGRVTFEYDESLPAGEANGEWTFDALRAYAEEHIRPEVEGEAQIHVLSLDGRYVVPGGGTVLGLAWSNRYIALFQDAIRSRCTGPVATLQEEICRLAERSVWAHEFGHVLGLVDNGLPMVEDHKDPEHGSHERTEGCLMYWAYEGPALFDTLLQRFDTDTQELTFCEASLADLEAAR